MSAEGAADFFSQLGQKDTAPESSQANDSASDMARQASTDFDVRP